MMGNRADRASVQSSRLLPVLSIFGGIAAVIGAFLAWIQLSGNIVLQVGSLPSSVAGMRFTEGLVVLVAGGVAALLGIVSLRMQTRPMSFVVILAALIMLGAVGVFASGSLEASYVDDAASRLAGADVTSGEVRSELEPALAGGGPSFSLGLGWYLAMAGGVVTLVAGLGIAFRRGARSATKIEMEPVTPEVDGDTGAALDHAAALVQP